MPAQLVKRIPKFGLIGFFFLFFVGSCATLDKLDRFIYDLGQPDPEVQQEPQPAKKVPLPPTIKDFESKTPNG
jgi:hypothetical protein